MKITPLGNLVLIEPITEQERSGIALPEKMQETNFGFVRAIGPGKDGTPITDFKVGDKVMLDKQTIWEDLIDGMRLVNVNHILAIMLPEGQEA